LSRFFGGQEVQGDQLARSWAGDRDVRAMPVASNPSLPGALRSLEAIPGVRTILRLPLRLAGLWRVVGDADVVHVFAGSHSSFLVGTVPAFLVARLRRRPCVIHYHSPRGDEHLARSSLARRVLRSCQAVVVPSSYLKDIFARHGVPSHVITNVVDDTRFPRRVGTPSGCQVICTRNFEARYAVEDVVHAFVRVKAAMPHATLTLAGSGPEEGMLRALVGSLQAADVTFAGALSRDAVASLLATASVMVNASRIDNQPVSILEAFAAGVPVVTTSAGGIPTIARHDDTALVVDVGDTEGLAAHVLAILRDGALAKRLTTAARAEAEECAWDTVRIAWLALYRECALTRSSSLV
jgi:glycosyltransferase involved in cell wall biosynthesis